MIRTAVIPAAGVGTRLLPVTKSVPKELLPVIDRPSIQYVVEEAVASGIDHIVLVVSPGKEALGRYFKSDSRLEAWLESKGKSDLAQELKRIAHLAKVTLAVQREPKGLGHAVLCARHAVGDRPFAVMLPDDLFDSDTPCLAQLLKPWRSVESPILALAKVPKHEVSCYGIVRASAVSKKLFRVEDLVEKPSVAKAPSNLGVIGRYLLPPTIFEALKRAKPGWGGEIQLTDGIRGLLQKGPVYGYVFDGERLDMGSRLGVIYATVHMALKRPDLSDAVRRSIGRLLRAPRKSPR